MASKQVVYKMAMNGNKGVGIGQSLGAEEKKEIKDAFDAVS